MNIKYDSIKLVIWDLDETFWKGILSEGEIEGIPENVQLIKDLTDRGIVNTICSKNDYAPAVTALNKLGIDDYFVFKSIDWSPKGQRVCQLIKDMGLRPVNCLFLDDNVVNLNEAKFYSNGLMIAEPSEIAELINYCSSVEPNDLNHKRLKQYKVLEAKQKAKAEVGDNLKFLYSSNTQVEIHEDCKVVADRLFELVHRTNQLNFTKLRSTREEFDAILNDDSFTCGYVTVKDNFGDYGIVGFFAMKDHRLIHFLFSCRTIGQGVEQWVYSTLNCPELRIVGEVVNTVENGPAPEWINQSASAIYEENANVKSKIVFKGPCDMEILSSFLISSNIIKEFTYVGEDKKNTIEHHNHSINYLSFPFLTSSEKQVLLDDCIFNDSKMFKTKMYDKDVSLVFLSTLIEPNLGVYERKKDGFRLAFGEWTTPLTDSNKWPLIESNMVYTSDNSFSRTWLMDFKSKYKYVGQITPEQVLENIKITLEKVSKNAKICLILGSEIPFLKNESEAYKGREVYHKKLNSLIREFAKEDKRVLILDFNDYVHKQEDFLGNINHFQRKIYYEASKKANEFIFEVCGKKAKEKGKVALLKSTIKSWAIELLAKHSALLKTIKKIIRKAK